MEDDERRTLWRRCNERLKVRQQMAPDNSRRIGTGHIDRSAQLFSSVFLAWPNEQLQPFDLLIRE